MEDDGAKNNSATDRGSEDEVTIALQDHSYCLSKGLFKEKNTKKVLDKSNGPYSMEKSQLDFDQLRSSKLKKVNLLTECCKQCKTTFKSVTEADIHVKRSNCFKMKNKPKGPIKNVLCEICQIRSRLHKYLKMNTFIAFNNFLRPKM